MNALETRRWLIGLAVLSSLLLPTGPAGAAEEILFGPMQFTRSSGPPRLVIETFSVPPTVPGPFRLELQ